MATRRELKEGIGQRYRGAGSWECCQIPDEFTRVTGYHRKHALRVFHRPFVPRPPRAPGWWKCPNGCKRPRPNEGLRRRARSKSQAESRPRLSRRDTKEAPVPPTSAEVLTVRELARYLNCHPGTQWQNDNDRELGPRKRSKKRRNPGFKATA